MFINRARRFVNSFHQRDSTAKPKILRNRFPMWKLALNVATFAGFNIFYIIWALFLLYNRNPCLFQRNYPLMMKLLGFIRLTLMARIIIDPILSFLTDFQVSQLLKYTYRRSQILEINMNLKLSFRSNDQYYPFSESIMPSFPSTRRSHSRNPCLKKTLLTTLRMESLPALL